MKRVLAVSGLLIAVVLPTACGSQHPTANVFSTQQVVRAFAKHGIRLQARRQALWEPADRQFYTPGNRGRFVSAEVLDPRDPIPYFLKPKDLRISREMDSRQRWTRLGNVLIGWLRRGKADRTGDKVRAALGSLRYSAADAARLLRPKLAIQPGESRTIDLARYPAGTTIACASGSLEVDELLTAHSVDLNSDSNKTEKITLRRATPSHSRRTYSCVRGAPPAPLHFSHNPKSCPSGLRTVRLGGVAARIPRGWYAATDRKHGLLWIANRPHCAVNWPTSVYGIYLMLTVESGGLGTQPEKAVRRFGPLQPVLAGGHIPGAYRASAFSAHWIIYLDVQMGADAPKHHGLEKAKFVLRHVTLPPSIKTFHR